MLIKNGVTDNGTGSKNKLQQFQKKTHPNNKKKNSLKEAYKNLVEPGASGKKKRIQMK